MSVGFSEKNIFKYYAKDRSWSFDADIVAHEKDVFINVGGRPFATLRASEGDMKELAVGHIFSCGLIARYGDVASMDVYGNAVNVILKAAPGPDTLKASYMAPSWKTSADTIFEGVKHLQEAFLYRKTGAFHAGLLLRRDGLKYFLVEDIGRHNVVEKVIGRALMQDVDMGECMLLISGRLMCELVSKVTLAGIPILGSVSATTCEAAALAEGCGMTLIGFIREGRMNVYTHPARIAEFDETRINNN
ncbi:FdhD protein [Acetomicrobium flavidum]|uniref:Protein FdhD n=1 Tax=Acetomicrobium flavidum TaxID=49896 RepID=A0ABY1JFK7_9BACT|nr:FdhD protein [Acetomicrobium flavidum]